MYLSKLRQISKQPANLLIDNIRKAAREQDRCNPLSLYKTIVERGCLKPDAHQLEAVARLDNLFQTIEKQARPVQAKVTNSKEEKKRRLLQQTLQTIF
jgi:predicted ATPase